MTAKRILIVEDEKAIRDMVGVSVCDVRATRSERPSDCREARARIVDVRPDLMLVDWMTARHERPGADAVVEAGEGYRGDPVIMLTARAEEQDKVGGLEGGADDYITQAVFAARVARPDSGGPAPFGAGRGPAMSWRWRASNSTIPATV